MYKRQEEVDVVGVTVHPGGFVPSGSGSPLPSSSSGSSDHSESSQVEGSESDSSDSPESPVAPPPLRRSRRNRRPPEYLRSGDFHTFSQRTVSSDSLVSIYQSFLDHHHRIFQSILSSFGR